MIFDYHKRYKDVYKDPRCLEERHILSFYSNIGKLLTSQLLLSDSASQSKQICLFDLDFSLLRIYDCVLCC